MGLLGRDTAETLGTLPSEGVGESVSSGEEERGGQKGARGATGSEQERDEDSCSRCVQMLRVDYLI